MTTAARVARVAANASANAASDAAVPRRSATPNASQGRDYDDREWDSPHCCPWCCDCCACHKISRAFWCVVLLTVTVFALAVGLLVDGFVKQRQCTVDYSSQASSDAYDSCRQTAYIQLWAAVGLGGVFVLLLFVSCCAFMDALCFRRFRSRPHLRPRTPRQGSAVTPRQQQNSPFVLYEQLPAQSSLRNLEVQTGNNNAGNGVGGARNGLNGRQTPLTQPNSGQQRYGNSGGTGRSGVATPQPQPQSSHIRQPSQGQGQLTQRTPKLSPKTPQQVQQSQPVMQFPQQSQPSHQQFAPYLAPPPAAAKPTHLTTPPHPSPAATLGSATPVGFPPVVSPATGVSSAHSLSPMPTLGERLREKSPAAPPVAPAASTAPGVHFSSSSTPSPAEPLVRTVVQLGGSVSVQLASPVPVPSVTDVAAGTAVDAAQLSVLVATVRPLPVGPPPPIPPRPSHPIGDSQLAASTAIATAALPPTADSIPAAADVSLMPSAPAAAAAGFATSSAPPSPQPGEDQ